MVVLDTAVDLPIVSCVAEATEEVPCLVTYDTNHGDRRLGRIC